MRMRGSKTFWTRRRPTNPKKGGFRVATMTRYTQEKAWSDFRVGVITFMGVFLLVFGVVLAGGDKGILFQRTSHVKALLPDVGGLKKGSSVTMGGMIVGRVTKVTFVDGKKNEIEVTMEIRHDVRSRIKSDSLPSVRTMGMLGDRYVDLSMGTEKSEVLPEGKPLVGDAASDFDKALREANSVMTETQKLLVAVNEQRGTAGRLVYDEELYKSLTQIANEIRDLVKDFKKNPRRYVKFSLF